MPDCDTGRCTDVDILELALIIIESMPAFRSSAALMGGFMPDWRARRDQRNSAPLAGEQWPEALPAELSASEVAA